MGKNRKYRGPWRTPPSSTTTAVGKGKYKAPTSGLEEVIFTWGTVRDAAKYDEVRNKLAQHIGVQSWKRDGDVEGNGGTQGAGHHVTNLSS